MGEKGLETIREWFRYQNGEMGMVWPMESKPNFASHFWPYPHSACVQRYFSIIELC